jgi:hypothetical protein
LVYPISSGRVVRVLRNSGNENYYPISALEKHYPQIRVPAKIGFWWQFWCLRRAWEVCLPTCAAGLVLDPTSFGGLLPLLGVLASGEMGVLAPTLWCQISISSSEVMATGHLQQPGRSVVYGMPMYSTYYSCWQWKTMMSRR